MVNIKLPTGFEEYHAIARKAELPNAYGRALYACNRRQMGWPRGPRGPNWPSPFQVLSSCRESTAKRWATHINSGGHIRNISLTRDEYLKRVNKAVRARKYAYKK